MMFLNELAFVVATITVGLWEPACAQSDTLTFLVLGDWGDYLLPGQEQVAYQMGVWAESHDVQFIVSTGDNFYPNGVRSVDDFQWETKWLWVYNYSSIGDLPWYVSVGNHDYGRGNGVEWNEVAYSEVNSRWVLPHLWHTFTYPVGDTGANVQFFAVDSEAIKDQKNNYTEQLEWLDEELDASDAAWKLVYAHRPIYSVGNYGPWSGTLENELLPILQRHGAHAYLCGHDHNLQLLNYVNGTGMDYIISGAGGALWYAYDEESSATLLNERGIKEEFFQMTWGFISFTMSDTEMTLEYVDNDGELIHTYVRNIW